MASSVKLSELVPSRFVHLTPPDEANIERIRADLVDGSKLILNPVHVFRNEDGKYEILAGHDRTEAARRAGFSEVPVREFRSGLNTDDAILSHFCIENLMRKEVSKAAIAETWIERHPDWTDGKVAEVSGCTREHVSKTRSVMLEDGRWQPVATVVGKDDVSRPARERKPRQRSGLRKDKPAKGGETRESVQHREGGDTAEVATVPVGPATLPTPPSAVTAPQAAPAPSRVAETRKVPEATGVDSTEPEVPAGPVAERTEVGEPTGTVSSPVPELGTDATKVSGPNLTPAVVEGGAVSEAPSLPEHIVVALSVKHIPLTRAQLCAMTDEQETRLTALSRFCQTTVAARRIALAKPAAA